MAFQFQVGDDVVTSYNGKPELLKIRALVEQPEEYEDVMSNLYEMSNGQVLKEDYLYAAPTGDPEFDLRIET